MEKMAVFAPIPSASVRIAMAANPGDFASVRRPNLKSCQSVCIGTPLEIPELSAYALPQLLVVKSICHLHLSASGECGTRRSVRWREKAVAETHIRRRLRLIGHVKTEGTAE